MAETFLHEEKRDFEYDFHYIDPNAPAVRVVARTPGGRYTVTKEFIRPTPTTPTVHHERQDHRRRRFSPG